MAEHHDIEYDDTLVTMFHQFILIDIGRGYGLNYEHEDRRNMVDTKKSTGKFVTFLTVAGGHYEVLGML